MRDSKTSSHETSGESSINNGAENDQTWTKIGGVVRTSSLNLSEIFVKNLFNKGHNTIALPKIQNEKFLASIFVSGTISILHYASGSYLILSM